MSESGAARINRMVPTYRLGRYCDFNNMLIFSPLPRIVTDMIGALLHTLSPEQVIIIASGLIYIGSKLSEGMAKWVFKKSDQQQELLFAVKELTLKLEMVTQEISGLKKAIDKHADTEREVWRIKKEVDFAHEKIREIKETKPEQRGRS